ncbi:MAG: 2-succinyl-5-enolpyruvyl-6-hydroxy-3-cyclohexene-1-carboxylic-acid synthase [Bacteroidia bacterium]|nr:2-succinyl-5-enolpyruvyl-6-hydroxy-3-cyclohexene-1-carboxylic-acid synthase [Bacteroidia bacterium]
MQKHVFTIAKVCENAGIKHAVICPGSRSAPLVYAFTQHTKINCISAVDERSAAFIALGMAQQTLLPVVLIATSGTACLNFFPAVAEAFYQKIPLLVLTADRPPELLNQQDGQMIMQKGVYGKHVLASHELLCYDENNIDYKLTERIVKHAIEESVNPIKNGPVHINVPLREPLYNLPIDISDVEKAITHTHEFIKPSMRKLPFLKELSDAWISSKKRLILVGQSFPNKAIKTYLEKISNADDVVILTDITSNYLTVANIQHFDAVIQFSQEEILEQLAPDFILSLGGPFVSKALKNWLKKQKGIHHFRLQGEPDLVNTYQNVSQPIIAEVTPYLESFQSLHIFKRDAQKNYLQLWKQSENKYLVSLENFIQDIHWSEPKAMYKILHCLPAETVLHLGNSSSVRWASWLGISNTEMPCYSNRGTSGIDGSVSTAVGAALANPQKIHTLIVGDLSLFYDQNAFWIKQLPTNLKIIVLNNGGGNIFNWIDGPSKYPDQLEYFTTPNQLSIANVCKQYGLNQLVCDQEEKLEQTMNSLYENFEQPCLLELVFDMTSNLSAIKAFKNLAY